LEAGTKTARGRRPYGMAQLRFGDGVLDVVAFLERDGGLALR
jgi:urease accessory protein